MRENIWLYWKDKWKAIVTLTDCWQFSFDNIAFKDSSIRKNYIRHHFIFDHLSVSIFGTSLGSFSYFMQQCKVCHWFYVLFQFLYIWIMMTLLIWHLVLFFFQNVVRTNSQIFIEFSFTFMPLSLNWTFQRKQEDK